MSPKQNNHDNDLLLYCTSTKRETRCWSSGGKQWHGDRKMKQQWKQYPLSPRKFTLLQMHHTPGISIDKKTRGEDRLRECANRFRSQLQATYIFLENFVQKRLKKSPHQKKYNTLQLNVGGGKAVQFTLIYLSLALKVARCGWNCSPNA